MVPLKNFSNPKRNSKQSCVSHYKEPDFFSYILQQVFVGTYIITEIIIYSNNYIIFF